METTTRKLLLLLLAGLSATAAERPLSRQWKIYVVSHPHVDIGYTELPAEVKRNWCVRIDQAMAAAARGFKWTLENSILFDVYAQMRPPEKVAELVRLAREGTIEIAALYTGINSDGAGAEELVRSTFYAAEELRRKYGIVTKTAMLSDVAGAAWGLPRALEGAGIRYFAFAPGRYKQLFDLVEHPELFYWTSPDGAKVLTRIGTGKYFFYGSGVMLRRPKTIEQDIAEMLSHYEALGKAYPYDAILLQDADDNMPPPVDLVDIIAKWNAAHANSRMILATPSEFFEYVEGKYRGQIPELKGDFTSAWADMMSNQPEATGVKRAAACGILSAEKFAVLAELLGTGFVYPQQRIRSVYEDLLKYTDHTYGISTWLWEHDALAQSGGALHAPVWNLYKESWEVKQRYAYRAAEASSEILGDALERLAAKIPAPGRTIVIFNSLSWSRTDVVRVASRLLKIETPGYEIVDATTGERIPYQQLDYDARYSRVAFIARDVPALGYKTYRVQPATAAGSAVSTVKREGNVIESEFYRVEVDPRTGAVRGIFDKRLGRELADQKGAEQVNQYLHHSLNGSHEALYNDKRTHLGRIPASEFQIAVQTPGSVRIVPGHTGPVLTGLRSEIRLDSEPATEITQEVTLYPGIKRIDFSNRIRKQATLAKEEAYYSFPFQVDNFRMRAELPGAVMEPYRDQLPGSFTGYSGIEHWVDVSSREFGVTLATREAPVIEFGAIRTNNWAVQYEPRRSAFFFYVINNRWNTNQALWQGNESWRRGVLELNFALTSHGGGSSDGDATRFGWQHNTPLAARVIEAAQEGTLPSDHASFSDGLPENVILQALKKAEDGRGYIARFQETAGVPRNVVWSGLPLKARVVHRTDLVERNLGPAHGEGGKIGFAAGAHRLVTLRLIP